jgi:hypothetical protein
MILSATMERGLMYRKKIAQGEAKVEGEATARQILSLQVA